MKKPRWLPFPEEPGPPPGESASLINVEGYDIPGGWEKLMEKYYDVMYSESYDWWTLALAFNTEPEKIEELQKYEFAGEDDQGVTVESKDQRVIVEINCRVDAKYLHDSYDEYEDDYEDEEEESEGEKEKGTVIVAGDKLLNLLVQVRQQLINRDYRTLYAVWEKYGYVDNEEEEEFHIPVPPDKKTGKNIVEQFRNILDEAA